MFIRQFHPDDLDKVVELHFAGLNQFGANAGIGPWDDDLKNIEETYINNNGEFFVCVVDDKLVGIGALKRQTVEVAEIKRMRVSMEFQGRGYGNIILIRLEESARLKGFKKLILDTTIKQVPAQKLYIKNGYVETKRESFRGVETIFYEKLISQDQL
jgi:ribosomal protein S18 acetylase RimI-like enzyme